MFRGGAGHRNERRSLVLLSIDYQPQVPGRGQSKCTNPYILALEYQDIQGDQVALIHL